MGTISGSGVANVRDHRPVHHPADEALRLSRRFRGRCRGHGIDGRPDHAAGDGRGGLHHGRDLDVPYAAIVKAAVVPAMLYFVTAFWMVHLEAGKRGLHRPAQGSVPQPLATRRSSPARSASCCCWYRRLADACRWGDPVLLAPRPSNLACGSLLCSSESTAHRTPQPCSAGSLAEGAKTALVGSPAPSSASLSAP
jgi:hypothetical protein